MKRVFSLFATIGITVLNAASIADDITQFPNGAGGTTTIIESPTQTTKITTAPGHSIMTKSKDGKQIEMDSDNSVYVVYPDGARVAAPDGITTLMGGTTITVKDGKRIP